MTGPGTPLLPRRERNYRFAMTPLADAMFQLLIFFMLSSSLTPYSLLDIQTASAAPPAQAAQGFGAAPAPSTPASDGPAPARWTVEEGAIRVGGQSFPLDQVLPLAEALSAGNNQASIVLVLHPAAKVQDISTVLADLRLAQVASVRIAADAEPGAKGS